MLRQKPTFPFACKKFFHPYFETIQSQKNTHHNILCSAAQKPENPCYYWGFGGFS